VNFCESERSFLFFASAKNSASPLKSSKQVGVFLVVLGNVLFSLKGIIVKLIYRYPVEPSTVITLRMLFALPFFLAAAYYIRRRRPELVIERGDWFNFALFALLGYYGASLLNFYGLKYVSAGLERIILFTYPTIVVLLSAIFYRVKVTRTQVIALLLTYLGIAIVFVPSLQHSPGQVTLGALFVFGSGFSFSIYLVRVGNYIKRFGSIFFSSHVLIIATAMVVVHFFLFGKWSELRQPVEVYGLFMLLAVFSTAIPIFLISEGIQRLGASNVSILASVGPVATIGLANVFLDEPVTLIQSVGTILVLLGVWLIGNRSVKEVDPEAMENRVR
jgi:drug/metabolite transporter (DMT)-like permease